MPYRILFLIVIMSWPFMAYTQVLLNDSSTTSIIGNSLNHLKDSTAKQITHLPSKYLSQVQQKSDRVQLQVTKRTDKTLARLAKQENKMQSKLGKIDSIAAKNIFTSSITKLNDFRSGLKAKVPINLPIGNNTDLDTLENSLKFLNGSKELLGNSQTKLKNATSSIQELRGSLQQADDIKTVFHNMPQNNTSLFFYSPLPKP